MDYIDMTMWQLEQERQKIIKEIERRIILRKRAEELELYYSPHRIQTSDIVDKE